MWRKKLNLTSTLKMVATKLIFFCLFLVNTFDFGLGQEEKLEPLTEPTTKKKAFPYVFYHLEGSPIPRHAEWHNAPVPEALDGNPSYWNYRMVPFNKPNGKDVQILSDV